MAGMRSTILLIAFVPLLLTGCPPTKASRRHIILNNTGSTIANLTISNGKDAEKMWDQTLPGQGWIYARPFGPHFLKLSWIDESGSHEAQFTETKTINRPHAEFYIELNPAGELTGRMIEPPPESPNVWALVALIPLYLLYCVVVVPVVGVPLALAIGLAYGLFKAIQTGFTSTIDGLRGKNTVFQFTTREVMMLMTVVAFALGWFLTLMRP
jgi:hypothetical protein